MFKVFGYYKEYYINGKFIGFIKSEKDREIFGFYGQRKEIVLDTIILDNKRKIKKDTEVVTQLFPLNGRIEN